MGIGQKIVNFLKINGITHEVSGKDIVIEDNIVYVDKKEITEIKEMDLRIEWSGPLANLTVNRGSVTCEDVAGWVDAGESIHCGDVGENVDAGDSVKAGNVQGKIDAGSSVTCGNVSGNIDAGDNVTCGNIGGNLDAIDVICQNVSGEITADSVRITK